MQLPIVEEMVVVGEGTIKGCVLYMAGGWINVIVSQGVLGQEQFTE
jgi:hypothetical protein